MGSMELGSFNDLESFQQDFFNAAKSGNKKILKKLIDNGKINDVDVKNKDGQTPLFYSCFEGQDKCVKYLLEKGANPNEASELGQTPLHAACYKGDIKSVSALVERGGDFRLHDKDHKTAKDWAMLNPNAKTRQMMTEYIVKTRMFAMTHSGRDVLLERQSSMFMRRPTENTGSITHLFKKLSRADDKDDTVRTSSSLMSLGYGKVYGGERGGIMSTIPMIAEAMLKHDDYSTTFSNGAFFVMEGMMLGPTKVTVKRLHHDPPKGGVVDHLIRECENIAHLRHPNVLLLMATCATDNMEGLVLVFERIYFGSLYNYLHEKNQQPASHAIVEAGLQICEGLIYIHQNNYLHNYISSHSIFLTNCNTLKIGNFEYMTTMTIGGKASRPPGVHLNKYLNATYNWMSPEMMKGDVPTEKSDLYSFCAVMWELYTGFVPWSGHDAEQIQRQVTNQKMLKVSDGNVPQKFIEVLTYGLQPSVSNRKMNMEQIRDILSLLPRRRSKQVSPSQQQNNHCSADLVSSSNCSPNSEQPYSLSKTTQIRRNSSFYTFSQALRCSHQTQTKDHDCLWDLAERIESSNRDDDKRYRVESLPMPPHRKKQMKKKSKSLKAPTPIQSSRTNLTSVDVCSMASAGSKSKKNNRRERLAQQRLQYCMTLKAPLHEELKRFYSEIQSEIEMERSLPQVTVKNPPVQHLEPSEGRKLSLHNQLKQELAQVFSQFDNDKFASLDLTELDAFVGTEEVNAGHHSFGKHLNLNLKSQEQQPVKDLSPITSNSCSNIIKTNLKDIHLGSLRHDSYAQTDEQVLAQNSHSLPHINCQKDQSSLKAYSKQVNTLKGCLSSASLEQPSQKYDLTAVKPAGHGILGKLQHPEEPLVQVTWRQKQELVKEDIVCHNASPKSDADFNNLNQDCTHLVHPCKNFFHAEDRTANLLGNQPTCSRKKVQNSHQVNRIRSNILYGAVPFSCQFKPLRRFRNETGVLKISDLNSFKNGKMQANRNLEGFKSSDGENKELGKNSNNSVKGPVNELRELWELATDKDKLQNSSPENKEHANDRPSLHPAVSQKKTFFESILNSSPSFPADSTKTSNISQLDKTWTNEFFCNKKSLQKTSTPTSTGQSSVKNFWFGSAKISNRKTPYDGSRREIIRCSQSPSGSLSHGINLCNDDEPSWSAYESACEEKRKTWFKNTGCTEKAAQSNAASGCLMQPSAIADHSCKSDNCTEMHEKKFKTKMNERSPKALDIGSCILHAQPDIVTHQAETALGPACQPSIPAHVSPPKVQLSVKQIVEAIQSAAFGDGSLVCKKITGKDSDQLERSCEKPRMDNSADPVSFNLHSSDIILEKTDATYAWMCSRQMSPCKKNALKDTQIDVIGILLPATEKTELGLPFTSIASDNTHLMVDRIKLSKDDSFPAEIAKEGGISHTPGEPKVFVDPSSTYDVPLDSTRSTEQDVACVEKEITQRASPERSLDELCVYKYNITCTQRRQSNAAQCADAQDIHEVEIICKEDPETKAVTATNPRGQAVVSRADQNAVEIILTNTEGTPKCVIKVSRSQRITSQDDTNSITTKHIITAEFHEGNVDENNNQPEPLCNPKCTDDPINQKTPTIDHSSFCESTQGFEFGNSPDTDYSCEREIYLSSYEEDDTFNRNELIDDNNNDGTWVNQYHMDGNPEFSKLVQSVKNVSLSSTDQNLLGTEAL